MIANIFQKSARLAFLKSFSFKHPRFFASENKFQVNQTSNTKETNFTNNFDFSNVFLKDINEFSDILSKFDPKQVESIIEYMILNSRILPSNLIQSSNLDPKIMSLNLQSNFAKIFDNFMNKPNFLFEPLKIEKFVDDCIQNGSDICLSHIINKLEKMKDFFYYKFLKELIPKMTEIGFTFDFVISRGILKDQITRIFAKESNEQTAIKTDQTKMQILIKGLFFLNMYFKRSSIIPPLFEFLVNSESIKTADFRTLLVLFYVLSVNELFIGKNIHLNQENQAYFDQFTKKELKTDLKINQERSIVDDLTFNNRKKEHSSYSDLETFYKNRRSQNQMTSDQTTNEINNSNISKLDRNEVNNELNAESELTIAIPFNVFIQYILIWLNTFFLKKSLVEETLDLIYSISKRTKLSPETINIWSQKVCESKEFLTFSTKNICLILGIIIAEPNFDKTYEIRKKIYSNFSKNPHLVKSFQANSVYMCFCSFSDIRDRLKEYYLKLYINKEPKNSLRIVNENDAIAFEFFDVLIDFYCINYKRFDFVTNIRIIYNLCYVLKTMNFYNFYNLKFDKYLWECLDQKSLMLNQHDTTFIAYIFKRFISINQKSPANWEKLMSLHMDVFMARPNKECERKTRDLFINLLSMLAIPKGSYPNEAKQVREIIIKHQKVFDKFLSENSTSERDD